MKLGFWRQLTIPTLSATNKLSMTQKKNVSASSWNMQEEEIFFKRLKNIKNSKSFSKKRLYGAI